ncbi:polysaccharide biosynthesis protein [Sulfurisoma sediminicola]|uniref:FlaA1/EpsC-like NDP-sugar epimerase n=1 Tax=Sulfurisoma sediminicola TaxID=1381557 RepID=A0A497XL48_9PROT|nr:nucleoside-diphosphate sugar epimerase/dehydratase [Sulfurisoma sediminicola]RLJ67986.1 FlaA1/EpsC-like NDP-sugar epimerase [Sulfurisoma sediminicola]
MNWRSALAFLHDLLATALMWLFAYWVRFNFEVPREFSAGAQGALLWVTPLYVAVYAWLGLYRGIWRYASMGDLRRLLVAVGLGALCVASVAYMTQATGIPRSVLLLHPILLVVVMGGSRFLYRAWKDGHIAFMRHEGTVPVLVLGAGDAAAQLLGELARSRDWHAVGLLDDNAQKHGRRIHDVPILGALADIAQHAERCQARHAIIAMPSASSATRRRAAELAAAAGLTVLTVPAFSDLMQGRVAISHVRKVELEDLLGREQVQLDDEGLHRLLTDKVVLVTGAGGSIGSELCRQIAGLGPRQLVFYELSEYALYAIDQEFAGKPIRCMVGDVKDGAALEATFSQYRPDVVFHAAAYKHVPLMENENAWQAVRNNVLGTLRVARAAIAESVGEFVLISTDKAVNPTNVMGASKRLAERVCEALQCEAAATRFVMVRFGNVLGSSGSVIPKFREQIALGGPVTVTHPDIIRYFMLIPEAAQLVLQAAAQGQGGEIFVLDMGEPVKIADLARDMIRLSGFTEDEIAIEFTGLRPGEKLYEELLADGETTLPTPHPKLRVMKAEQAPDATWLAELEEWLAAPVRSEAEVKEGLKRWVPEYRPAQH